MAKILVCDICLSENRLTEAERYKKVKGKRNLRVDFCNEHEKEIPKDIVNYTKFVYGLRGIDLSEEDIDNILRS